MVLEYSDVVKGYRWLLRRYTTASIKGTRQTLKLKPFTRTTTHQPMEAVKEFDWDHPYMLKRGLDYEVIDLFGLGYDKKTNSITIPMRDIKGNILFYKKRPLGYSGMKYNIEEGVEKRGLLFGMDIVYKHLSKVDMIYLSEGEFDVMSWYAIGRYGVGLQGSELYSEQVAQLKKFCRGKPICIATDNDKAGREGKARIVALLKDYFILYELVYPIATKEDGRPRYKDPNDLLLADILDTTPVRLIRAYTT
jgi:DNA primase